MSEGSVRPDPGSHPIQEREMFADRSNANLEHMSRNKCETRSRRRRRGEGCGATLPTHALLRGGRVGRKRRSEVEHLLVLSISRYCTAVCAHQWPEKMRSPALIAAAAEKPHRCGRSHRGRKSSREGDAEIISDRDRAYSGRTAGRHSLCTMIRSVRRSRSADGCACCPNLRPFATWWTSL